MSILSNSSTGTDWKRSILRRVAGYYGISGLTERDISILALAVNEPVTEVKAWLKDAGGTDHV